MIGTIMSATAQIILIILSVIIYVYLVACIFPKIFLRPKYDISDIKDRGLKRYSFRGGRAIVYQPALNIRKYIAQYILSSTDGEKHIKCKVDKRILSIKYDVIAFDSEDRVIDTVEISDGVKSTGYTHAALLPMNTAYITLIIKEVNDVRIEKERKLAFSAVKIALFAVLEILATVIEALLFENIVVSFMSSAFSLTLSAQTGFALLTSMAAGAVLAILIFLLHFSKDTKIGK